MSFSIESAMENIPIAKTKEYFNEVYQTYVSGHYRSSVVMLWSVIVCDLLYKLHRSIDEFQDQTAKDIIEEIDEKRASNPNSPIWEDELLKLVKERLKLLNNVTCGDIDAIRKHRHLSAHPVLDDNNKLYSPTKEICRAHIRHALEHILTKSPIISKNIINIILEDLSDKKELFSDYDNLRTYLQTKYIKNMTQDLLFIIFKAVWKLTFKTRSSECDENRQINSWSLAILLESEKAYIEKKIIEDEGYFSTITLDDDILHLFFRFLTKYPSIWSPISNILSPQIATKISENPSHKLITHFMHNDYPDFMSDIDKITLQPFVKEESGFTTICSHVSQNDHYVDSLVIFHETAQEHNEGIWALKFVGKNYYTSGQYDIANFTFDYVIKPYLHLFSREVILDLLNGIDHQSQCYDRRQFPSDLRSIKKHCEKNNIIIDSDEYSNIATYF